VKNKGMMNVSDCTVHELREVSTRDPTTYQVRAVQARGMPCQGTLCWMKEYWERRRDRPARRAANARNVLNLLKVMYINNSVNVWNDNPTFNAVYFCQLLLTYGDQEAEVASFSASVARASVDSVA